MNDQPTSAADDVQRTDRGLSRRYFVRNTTAGAIVVLGTSLVSAPGASAAARPQCAVRGGGSALWVTPDCDDPQYTTAVIDSETDLTTPVRHRKVSGHFQGTDKKFTFYLPSKKRWEGRFFHKVYPLQDENASDTDISFGADSGAYVVQTNGGGGYRVDAAAAKFSRTYAAKYYGTSKKIYGYVWGGSGGSFQTYGAMENTEGVWDGAVPFIPGTPYALPSSFTVRALARLILRDKAPRIADAVRPGGSGDPYAGLSQVEHDMLRETTGMGVPLRAWEGYDYVLGLPDPELLVDMTSIVRAMDPTYADDFWNTDGYLGTEKSDLGDIIRAARIDRTCTVGRINRDAAGTPTSLVLDNPPAQADTAGLDITVYAADGTTSVGTLSGSLAAGTGRLTLASGNSDDVLDALTDGTRLHLDNRWSLAFRAYHRYQVPTRSGFHAYDQYRDAAGKPLYPQRPVAVGPVVSQSISDGGTHTGAITGKVIVVGTLMDADAYPWPADWYRAQVEKALGARYGDDFRLWYQDNADHVEGPVAQSRAARIVAYDGILQQALRDVSAWAERGVRPAGSTAYSVSGTQISVPEKVSARHGIQPVVDLTVGGTDRIEVRAGHPVVLKARIEVPRGAGSVVRTEWDFEGTGTFTKKPFGRPRRTVEVERTVTYDKPGTYFPGLRATAQREGDTTTPFAHVPNLGRVRVVVR